MQSCRNEDKKKIEEKTVEQEIGKDTENCNKNGPRTLERNLGNGFDDTGTKKGDQRWNEMVSVVRTHGPRGHSKKLNKGTY